MNTECSAERIDFHGLGGRGVVGRFDGGQIRSDGGCVLLREVEERTHILKRLAGCFVDHRDPELMGRLGGIARQTAGVRDSARVRRPQRSRYPTLRRLAGAFGGQGRPSGAGRRRTEDRGKALAGKSTLNRLELTPKEAGRRTVTRRSSLRRRRWIRCWWRSSSSPMRSPRRRS